ncbi:thiol-disulfide oxidoreductase DCC family protein [Priestia endophytica]|uniref:thiol-disulfide oxidoreductase DCC family protein n=1 Tax=Priestia endophytica TaxID=135735 RepID=UPI002E1FE269|nr:DCC1-like thiol-disulfide oxidoreductase family protein [Priestia endophytica]MED4072145.1 DCC1-like thiol-disulfide oxidoreductase family protein [Priestia endophytica]
MSTQLDNCSIIMFDDVCNVCNHWVQFVLKRDPDGVFKFLSLRSNLAASILSRSNLDTKNLDSIILVDKGTTYIESTSVLKILHKLKGPIKVLLVLWIIPKPIRDWGYRMLARNRYKWFGENKVCMVLTSDIKDRFIKDENEIEKRGNHD